MVELDETDIVKPEHLPPLGKWMYGTNMNRAHWLGAKIDGKSLIEPINIILADDRSRNPQEAVSNILVSCRKAGFDNRFGHSSGYAGWISEEFYYQLPVEPMHAFSDAPAEVGNNHGRIFGPFFRRGKFYFTASFSREAFDPVANVKHRYVSFNQARDRFSEMLQRKSGWKLARFVSMENALIWDTEETTGDHDGIAVMLMP